MCTINQKITESGKKAYKVCRLNENKEVVSLYECFVWEKGTNIAKKLKWIEEIPLEKIWNINI